ncbi:MAG: peptidase [Microcystis aeruginosa Ma_AC_P_19900807_S299]|jgi:hypothetical protein|nr:MAG: peptidase [Microcystis aeruginosa Ma_AC_P_19900807_S299]
MLDQSFNLSDSNVLDDIFQLPTLVVESGLGRSDLITPVSGKSLQGMDSGFLSNSVEEYQLELENRWQSSQSLSSSPNGGDFLTGQSSFVGVSSSVDLAGNTLATARAITVGSSTTSYTDWVGSTDTNDYYRFTLANSADFNLSLTGMTADADVQLLYSSGSPIASSTNGGTASESITRQLSAGTYYIRVYPYSGNTNYNLAVSATGIDLAGNTLATARAITVGSSTTSYTDWVGSTDTNDYYRFSLANSANFNLSLTGMTADADVQLLYSSGSPIVSSTNGGTAAESITRQLSAGTYYIRVYPYSGNTNYNLAVSASGGGDWFSQNLRDAGLISTARSLAADGNFSRNDMISIFRNAEDGSVIDATELTDLRTIVSNASRFTMQDPVVFLSNSIANGNTANQWWTGGGSTRQTLGNLYAGSSTTQMERLIGKWFLGLDRPTAASGTTYRYCSGSLIQSGVSYQDIDQGNLGDCYLLASLAGTAYRTPSTIQNMFTDNGDGTFTVRFFRNGVANYVTVDRYLPTTASGSFYYANRDRGLLYNNTGNELWVALAERAYAQINESGWIGGNNTNSYNGVDGGTLSAISHITGLSNTGYISPLNTSELVRAYNANRITYLSDGGHAYTLVGYNSSTGVFTVYNPWGHTETYTNTQMTSKFVRFGYSGSRV